MLQLILLPQIIQFLIFWMIVGNQSPYFPKFVLGTAFERQIVVQIDQLELELIKTQILFCMKVCLWTKSRQLRLILMACIRLFPITLFALLFTFYFLCYPLFYTKKKEKEKLNQSNYRLVLFRHDSRKQLPNRFQFLALLWARLCCFCAWFGASKWAEGLC